MLPPETADVNVIETAGVVCNGNKVLVVMGGSGGVFEQPQKECNQLLDKIKILFIVFIKVRVC